MYNLEVECQEQTSTLNLAASIYLLISLNSSVYNDKIILSVKPQTMDMISMYLKAFQKHLNIIIVCTLYIGISFAFNKCVYAQQDSSIGTFDISKVQKAMESETDSPAASAVRPFKKESENYFWVITRITIYLAIIIGVILGVGYLVKRAGISGSSRIGGGSMDILEVLQLGQNRSAMLVRVMDAVYLLGQTPNSIVLLEKIEGQKAIDLISSSKGGSGSVMQFKEVFNNFMGKMKKTV